MLLQMLCPVSVSVSVSVSESMCVTMLPSLADLLESYISISSHLKCPASYLLALIADVLTIGLH